MIRLAMKRVLHALPVWLGISILAFALLELAPGDPATTILERRTGNPPTLEAILRLRQDLGLEAPLPVRYARWLGNAVTGDWGESWRTGEPVLQALLNRFPYTLTLAAATLFLSTLVALPIGIWIATRRDEPVDHVMRFGTLLVGSLPSFWLAYLLILLFSLRLSILPVAGWGGIRHLILPTLALSAGVAARLSRFARATLLEEIGKDYVTTARGKGLAETAILVRHCLRCAAVPLLIVGALTFGHLLAGAIVIETVFSWPGIGNFVIDAIYDRDYPVIQGFVLFTGTIFLVLNLSADLAQRALDPRLRDEISAVDRSLDMTLS